MLLGMERFGVIMIINLTPHAIVIYADTAGYDYDPDATPLRTIRSSGEARIVATSVDVEPVDGLHTTITEWGEVEGLPAPVEGTVYLVSALVLGRLSHRADLVGIARPVRDGQGRTRGCRGLRREAPTTDLHVRLRAVDVAACPWGTEIYTKHGHLGSSNSEGDSHVWARGQDEIVPHDTAGGGPFYTWEGIQ